jgi:hypothetical protein
VFDGLADALKARKIGHSGEKDRGFMRSIYFNDPLGHLIELASYVFEPPFGHSHTDVLHAAHRVRVEAGDAAIETRHIALAIERLGARRPSLSD